MGRAVSLERAAVTFDGIAASTEKAAVLFDEIAALLEKVAASFDGIAVLAAWILKALIILATVLRHMRKFAVGQAANDAGLRNRRGFYY